MLGHQGAARAMRRGSPGGCGCGGAAWRSARERGRSSSLSGLARSFIQLEVGSLATCRSGSAVGAAGRRARTARLPKCPSRVAGEADLVRSGRRGTRDRRRQKQGHHRDTGGHGEDAHGASQEMRHRAAPTSNGRNSPARAEGGSVTALAAAILSGVGDRRRPFQSSRSGSRRPSICSTSTATDIAVVLEKP